ncbi:thioredoxin-like domain-containing protein [Phthorimaea operculella]|nr:thioredoxin-like domain-containing protein [Phthorimaea operculella]
MARWVKALAVVLLLATAASAARKPAKSEPQIEEVTAKQLERLLEDKDFVAVFWYARSCVTCDKVLEELEKIDDDTDTFGVDFVKINDKRLAKQYGITKFPALTYFREKEPIIYDGDLMDEESVLDFLTSLEAMDLPDRIEEVNQKILGKIIEDTKYVAVLFCPDHKSCGPSTNKPECRKCAKALQELENIDDEADQLGIGFVKIHDEELAEEYSLGELPRLVYYRHEIPIIYEGELSREEDVLEWLIANKSTGDEEDVIEDVTAKTLNTLIGNVDNLVVLFYDHGDDDSMTVLAELEKIDDDCDRHGIQFVKIDDEKAASAFGIDNIPAIVYFEKQIPNVYDGDLENEDEILEWLVGQLEKDEIEDVTDEMLDRLIKDGKTVAVLFYDNNDRKSQKVLNELENIDDECDQLGIAFVKIDNDEEAKEYGIEKVPTLLYFEKGIPTYYEGNLEEEEKVLKWLHHQSENDEIEDITDEMLDLIIDKMQYVAVLFYDKDQKKSQKILAELENIDDECDQNDIAFVKIDDDKEAKEYGIDTIPTMVFFERKIPHVYEGDLLKEDELLGWLLHQKRHSEIPEVTDEMMDKLIENTQYLAVIFYDKDDKQDIRILNELENIDDELEKEGIVIVRMDNEAEAKEFGIDHLPTLVYFEENIPAIYEGDLMNEDEVLAWLLEQKNSATIEEVTDEILTDLIEEHEYVVVYFSGSCEEGEECDNILDELENIDDELDETGIIFVTTEDLALAKKYGIKTFPTLVFFRNKDPLIYKGDIEDEDEVLSWLTDEDTLEIPGKIEEVNSRMLDKILEENDHVVVFFYVEGDKKSQKILQELENIDDECEEKDIDFIKTSDEGIEKEYDLPGLPALAFYRHKFRTIYEGDLMHEEAILKWVLDLHDSQPDVIESVDRKTLKDLIEDVEHLAVFFYSDDCDTCDEVLEELETIDDDTDKYDIQFVKSKDSKLASDIGIFSFPALVYYETGVPIMYDGDLKKENKVLQWLIDQKSDRCFYIGMGAKPAVPKMSYEPYQCCPTKVQSPTKVAKATPTKKLDKEKPRTIPEKPAKGKSKALAKPEKGAKGKKGNLLDEHEVLDWMVKQKEDESIEEIDREQLFKYIETKEFLAVVFYKEEDPKSPQILRHVELIDDEASEYAIKIVKCPDRLMAKKYGFRNPPGITYFRKGKYINYDGDMDDEEEILDWLTNPENMELTDHIEKVNRKMFQKIRQTSDYVAVFFLLAEIEHIDDDADGAGINFVKINDWAMAKEFGVFALPAVLFFKMGSKDPVIYAGDLYDEQQLLSWLLTQKNPAGDVIEALEGEELLKTIKEEGSLAVYFWNKTLCEFCNSKAMRKASKKRAKEAAEHEDEEPEEDGPDCDQCVGILEELENIDDDCDRHGIKFVKTQDYSIAESYGVTDFPVLVYFEDNIPNVYEGSLAEEEEVLQWLITQKTEDRIELITRVMLEKMVEETQYLAVYFYKLNCHICDAILEGLEKIDDECDVFGIHMVKIQDPQLAKRYSIKTFPAMVYFRNGNPLLFEGDLQNEESILEWLIDDDNRELADEIESVNERMLERLLAESHLLVVFFYDDEDCPECEEILEELEQIDGEVDQFGIDFVKIADPEAAAKYNVINIPSLIYFRKQTPMLYDGDLHQVDRVLQWLTSQDVFEIKNEIEEVNRKMLDKLLEENEFLAVYFYEKSPESRAVLDKLENIDSETDNLDITFVKMQDARYARKWGVTKLPAIVYFRKRFPSIFRGDLMNEDEVLEWLRKNRFRQPELNIFMYALIALSIAFVMYTAFLLKCFKPAPPPPTPHPKQA